MTEIRLIPLQDVYADFPPFSRSSCHSHGLSPPLRFQLPRLTVHTDIPRPQILACNVSLSIRPHAGRWPDVGHSLNRVVTASRPLKRMFTLHANGFALFHTKHKILSLASTLGLCGPNWPFFKIDVGRVWVADGRTGWGQV